LNISFAKLLMYWRNSWRYNSYVGDRGGHRAGWAQGGAGGYWPFPNPPHTLRVLIFQPATRAKITKSAHIWGLRGGLMRVGFFSSILVSAASQTSKHKLHNPTGNIKTINNEKKKTKE
jgi:hypothetical protein